MLVLINLQRTDVRRARMTAQLDDHGVPFERLGHDFRGRDRSEIARWYAVHFPSIRLAPGALSGAELGCWASHLSAWRRIQEAGATAGTVLEDDLVLAPGFGARVRELEDDLRDFDLVYLGTSSRNLSTRRVTTIGRHRVHAPVGLVVNTWGYVVSSGWIARVLAHPSLAITMPVDHFLGGRGGVAKPLIGVVQPACVHEDPRTARDSQIQPHTWRPDRFRVIEGIRRRFLGSRASDWFYRVYRWL